MTPLVVSCTDVTGNNEKFFKLALVWCGSFIFWFYLALLWWGLMTFSVVRFTNMMGKMTNSIVPSIDIKGTNTTFDCSFTDMMWNNGTLGFFALIWWGLMTHSFVRRTDMMGLTTHLFVPCIDTGDEWKFRSLLPMMWRGLMTLWVLTYKNMILTNDNIVFLCTDMKCFI